MKNLKKLSREAAKEIKGAGPKDVQNIHNVFMECAAKEFVWNMHVLRIKNYILNC